MSEPVNFEVRVLGRVGPAGREALADVDVRVEPATTRLSGALDQAALHTLLQHLWALGLEIVDLRRIGMQPSGSTPESVMHWRLLDDSGRTGVRPDSVQVFGGTLSSRLPTA